MANGIVPVPTPVNEPIRAYAPGSPEKASLKARLQEMLSGQIEIPLIIGGREIRTGRTATAVCPQGVNSVTSSTAAINAAMAQPGRKRGSRRPCPQAEISWSTS